MLRKCIAALPATLILGVLGCGAGGGNPASSSRGAPGDRAALDVMPPKGEFTTSMVAPDPGWGGTAADQEAIDFGAGGDKHAYIQENPFIQVADAPLSTFSVDVDTASYSKVRAYLLDQRSLPPPDAVRIEELVNYFDYDYSPPADEHPIAVHLESAVCPWQPNHRLVRCGLQGTSLSGVRPRCNLVFLIDVSGSMDAPNKLPLVKSGLEMLVRQLGEDDRVAIVVYAGAAGLALPTTSGRDRPQILAALESLRAGGSTNGGQGIQLAYGIAQENFIHDGTNRVILCSDGDFNVGLTSPGDLVRLAIEKSKAGVFLSVLGFGFGNHNDAMLEEIAGKADGNYAFIDTQAEARKVLVEQMAGTLIAIARDVKIQVEFNPAQVAAYRLIGYENRLLADRDFNDDAKDAGEVGVGHRVTAFYEVIPLGGRVPAPRVDPLRYQPDRTAVPLEGKEVPALPTALRDELLTFKLRYQPPSGGVSTLLTCPLKAGEREFGQATTDFRFAAAVASFGMLLRNSEHRGDTSYAAVLETASRAAGDDKHGYRREFLEVVRAAARLSKPPEENSKIPAAWSDGGSTGASATGYTNPSGN